jgi:shikimate dehydrogenase
MNPIAGPSMLPLGGQGHSITGSTTLVGLLGWPVEHSLSPTMHNAAFASLGLDWAYVPLPVYPDHIGEAIRGLRAMGFAGANVTVPHKQAVLHHLDDIAQDALVIGAVNTIVVRDDQLIGDNTDAAGFLASLAEAGFDPDGIYAAVLGAGGAARSVVHALAVAGARQVCIYNRHLRRATELCRDMAKFHTAVRFEAYPLEAVDNIGDDTSLLINSTSLGMWPDTETSPWPTTLPIPGHLTVYDLVYRPRETLLLTQARAVGAEIVDGMGMLVHQGAAAFELWTGSTAPVEVMRAGCEAGMRAFDGDAPDLQGRGVADAALSDRR